MKNQYVSDFKKDDKVLEFFMVKNIGIKVGSNGKAYLDITLADNSGEISGKKWDVQPGEDDKLLEIKDGDLVRIKGIISEWQGVNQLRIEKIRPAAESDGLDPSDYIKAAPEDPKEMYDYIYGVADNMNDLDLRAICLKILEDNREKLMYYPAASKNHHAEFAGLLFHTKRMLMTGLGICQVYTDLDQDLLSAGVIVHDIEKINEILSNQYGISPGYSLEGQMLGHLVMGVKYIDRIATELGIPTEKALMLEHMVLSHHYEPEFGSPKRPLFPEAEVLHYLDMMDAKLFDMFEAVESAEPGDFSDKIWTLHNRKIYRREDR